MARPARRRAGAGCAAGHGRCVLRHAAVDHGTNRPAGWRGHAAGHDARRREQATRLYRDHAEVKVKLFELEHKQKDDPTWIEDVRALRAMLEEHIRQEEQVEFPKLLNALDETRAAALLGEVHREKAMLM